MTSKDNQYNMGCPCCMARYTKEMDALNEREKRLTVHKVNASRQGYPGPPIPAVFETAQKNLDAERELLRSKLTS